MATVSVDMLQSAIGEVDQRIQAAVAEVERKIMESIEGAVTTQRESLKEGIANDVMEFHSGALKRTDGAITAAMADQKIRIDAMFDAAAKNFEKEQRSVRELVQVLEAKLLAVQDGNFEKIATRLIEIEAAEKTRAQLLASMHESLSESLGKRFASDEAEITRLGGLIQTTISDTDAKLKYLESTINNGIGSPSTSGLGDAGSPAPRLRIPDLNNWGFNLLKDRED